MRKLKKRRKFSRKSDQRKALLRGLADSLILEGKIKTTEAKAKEVSVFIEKQISRAKKGDLAARRFLSRFFSPKATKKLVEEIAPKYKARPGGYTKIIKLGPRKSNGAKMAIIELMS
jgi:large subunit ribosomal protein L17